MRDLSSKSLTSSEAILTAVLIWWLSGHPDLMDRVFESNIWHTPPKSLREDEVGYAIWEASKFGRAEERFWQEARGNPATKYLVELAVENWRSRGRESGISGVRAFVKTSLVRLLARTAKERGLIPKRVLK